MTPGHSDFVMRSTWPKLDRVDVAAEESFGQVIRIVEEVRGHRQAAGAPPRGGNLTLEHPIDHSVASLAARLARVELVDELEGGTPLAAVPGRVSFPSGGEGDSRRKAELKRLMEELEKTEANLGNPDFQAKAPPEIVRKLQERAAELRAAIDRLK